MAGKAVPMETRLLAVFTAGLSSVNVSELCAELGVSRQTFYKWRRRFETNGVEGLVERSRRPLLSPNQVSAELEDEIVRARKGAKEAGEDYGAEAIMFVLRRRGWDVPAVSTVHRVLVRRGLVVPEPQKRPHSATRRFVWPHPNGAWQIDATGWVLADGDRAWIVDMLDDHSRVVPALVVCEGEATTGEAWEALGVGMGRFGAPRNVMSDNGSCFTGRFLSGGEVVFEANLRQAGIGHVLSSPGHPQTCGKLERFHQTLKKWLAARPRAESRLQLQAQLDVFYGFYNYERPHRALKGAVPFEVWSATTRDQPGDPAQPPARVRVAQVDRLGTVSIDGYVIGVGVEHASRPVLILSRGLDVSVITDGSTLRKLKIDPTRRYQPTGKPPGRRPKLIRPCN